jgi:hypothetical protein
MVRVRRFAEHGQASVELVLVLPLVVLAMLLVLQVGLVVAAHLQVVHAARDGARAASVRGDPAAARAAVARHGGLGGDRTEVVVDLEEGATVPLVSVEVRHRVRTEVPLVGQLVGDPTVSATTVMALESVPVDP